MPIRSWLRDHLVRVAQPPPVPVPASLDEHQLFQERSARERKALEMERQLRESRAAIERLRAELKAVRNQ